MNKISICCIDCVDLKRTDATMATHISRREHGSALTRRFAAAFCKYYVHYPGNSGN